MAVSALAFALFAGLSVGHAAEHQFKVAPGRCSGAPEIDFTESINAYLRRIPNNITMPINPDRTWPMGIKISSSQVTGLASLWAYKQYHTFCAGNSTLMEVVVFADDPLTFGLNWKSCTGHRGKLETKVSSSKLRLYFMPEPTPEDPTKVIMYNIEAESLDRPALLIEGAPSGLRGLVGILNVVAMPYIELFWRRFLGVDVMSLLRDDLRI
uniref:Putative secreted protein n=1 Tax=Amblyomma cajennense TaxID=34607 RepID=A0A023FF92_AMBCJ